MRDEGPLCRLHPAKLQKKKKLGTGGGFKGSWCKERPPPSSPLLRHRLLYRLGRIRSLPSQSWGLLRLQSLWILPPGKSKGKKKGGDTAQSHKRAW